MFFEISLCEITWIQSSYPQEDYSHTILVSSYSTTTTRWNVSKLWYQNSSIKILRPNPFVIWNNEMIHHESKTVWYSEQLRYHKAAVLWRLVSFFLNTELSRYTTQGCTYSSMVLDSYGKCRSYHIGGSDSLGQLRSSTPGATVDVSFSLLSPVPLSLVPSRGMKERERHEERVGRGACISYCKADAVGHMLILLPPQTFSCRLAALALLFNTLAIMNVCKCSERADREAKSLITFWEYFLRVGGIVGKYEFFSRTATLQNREDLVHYHVKHPIAKDFNFSLVLFYFFNFF